MMSEILPAVRDMLTAALSPSPIEQVYYGGDEIPEVIFRSSQVYLVLEDGGEVDLADTLGQIKTTQYNVNIELGVRMYSGSQSLPRLLEVWESIENVIFLPENRVLPSGGERLADDVGFFNVDSGYLVAPNNPTWRYRSAVVPYKKTMCRRTFP